MKELGVMVTHTMPEVPRPPESILSTFFDLEFKRETRIARFQQRKVKRQNVRSGHSQEYSKIRFKDS